MLIELRKKTDRLLADFRHARRNVKEETQRLEEAEKSVASALEAQSILQGIAETVQNQAHQRIASVVTRCLEAVFGDGLEFRIRFEQRRGRTDAVLLFVKNGEEIDPIEASGGGVIDLAAFSLRLACLTMSMPRKRKVLIFDEAFRFLSKEYRPAVRKILLTLAKEMGIQMILVTHSPELVAGRMIEI